MLLIRPGGCCSWLAATTNAAVAYTDTYPMLSYIAKPLLHAYEHLAVGKLAPRKQVLLLLLRKAETDSQPTCTLAAYVTS